MKPRLDTLVAKRLASLQEGGGSEKETVTVQQDVELVYSRGHGDSVKYGHTDDGSDQASHGHTATAQGSNALFTE